MATSATENNNQQVKTVCCSCADEVNKTLDPKSQWPDSIDLRDFRVNGPASLVNKQSYESWSSLEDDKGAKCGPSTTTKPPFKYVGVIGCLVAAFFFSIATVCMKKLPNSNTLQDKVGANFWRGVFITVFCSMAILFKRSSFRIKRAEIYMNSIRIFFSYFGSLGVFIAIHWITVGEATAIAYAAPLWTTILGYFILHESFPLTAIVAIPISFLGLLMIAKPDLLVSEQVVEDEVLGEVERHHHLDQYLSMINSSSAALDHPNQFQKRHAIDVSSSTTLNLTDVYNNITDIDLEIEHMYFETRWPGIIIAMATSLVVAIMYITLKIQRTTPIETFTFWLGIGTMIMSSLIQCAIGFASFPASLMEWSILFALGLNSWLAQTTLQWAMQYEKASVISIVRTVEVVMAFCWGTTFLEEDLLWTSILGAAIIILVVVLLVVNDYIEKLLCSRYKR